TFQLMNGAAVIGSAVTSAALNNGITSVTYALPAGTAVGTYTIHANYNGTLNFTASNDNTKVLTIQKALTTTTAVNATASYSPNAQTVTLTATVTWIQGAVNEGAVTFQISNGAGNVGSAVISVPQANGV